MISLGAKLLKVNTLEASVVSQALIGGPATAVAIGQISGSKKAAGIGMFFGILGYGVGNYIASLFYYLLL